MIFLDTSAIYALADRSDAKHNQATQAFDAVQQAGEAILTHSYVIVESAALLHKRLGRAQALTFLREASAFETVWVTPELHEQAISLLESSGAAVSLVDAVSFVVMRLRGARSYLGFDGHFADEGLTQFTA